MSLAGVVAEVRTALRDSGGAYAPIAPDREWSPTWASIRLRLCGARPGRRTPKMPGYRFSWDNLPPEVLANLAEGLRGGATPAEALRAAYGARPKACHATT
jgi:hypothetical protein